MCDDSCEATLSFFTGLEAVRTASVMPALGTDCFHGEETVQEWR